MTPIDETIGHIQSAVRFIQDKTNGFEPEIGLILGTGLGYLADEVDVTAQIRYQDIPHFPTTTVESHSGYLLFGKLAGKQVVCMKGRFHYYEGYTMQEVALPVRVIGLLGVKTLIVSNASGALNPLFKVGDVMLIEDHISFFLPGNPLIGPHHPSLGERFPDMCDPYDPDLLSRMVTIAQKEGIAIQKGVYVAVPGPQLETRAEYRLLRNSGADAVGMSTIPEVIAARQLNIACVGLSVITDMGIPETLQNSEFSKILAAAAGAAPGLISLVRKLIADT